MTLRQREVAIRSHCPNSKANSFEFCGQFRRVVEPHAMHLVIPSVGFPDFSEAHDPTFHRTPLDVLLPLRKNRPVLSHAETPRPGTVRHLSRREHVEDEDAAGYESVVNAPEKASKPSFFVLRVEEVVEDLAYGRDGPTTWDLHLEQRPHPELGLGHSIARELDHSLGDVDPPHSVAGVYELPRPQPATTTEVDNEATAYPALVQDLHYSRRRSEGELGVPDVVDVSEVLPVPPRRVRAFRGYLNPL